MSLATRCPHCKTVFQVSEAQLKLRSGTVRCGVCQTPFNGIDSLVGRISSRKTAALPQNPGQPNRPVFADNQSVVSEQAQIFITDQNRSITDDLSRSAPGDPNNRDDSADKLPPYANEALKEAFDRQLQSLSLDLNDPVPHDNDTETPLPGVTEAHATFENTAAKDKNVSSAVKVESIPVETEAIDKAEKEEPDDSIHKTGTSVPLTLTHVGTDKLFPANTSGSATEDLAGLLQKKRKKSRISITLWSVGSILLAVILFGQFIHHYSGQIVAWWPPAEGFVESACELLSCHAQKPAESVLLSVEYGKLIEKEGTNDQLTQRIVITNNSSSLQLWPLVVLEITDMDDNVLSRKILSPQEYLPEESSGTSGLKPSETAAFELAIEFRHDSAINSRITILNHSLSQ